MSDSQALSSATQISEQEVLAYLQDNPGLIDLVAPSPAEGNVVNFQAAKAERLAERTRDLSDELAELMRTGRRNTIFLKRAEQAMCLLLDASSLEDLLARINQDLPALFKFDHASLCLSTERGKLFQSPDQHAFWLTPSSLANAMQGQDVLMTGSADVEARLFGPHAFTVKSAALVQLNLPRLGIAGVLALGSAKPGFVDPADSDDVLRFLGLVTERMVQLWVLLDLASQ